MEMSGALAAARAVHKVLLATTAVIVATAVRRLVLRIGHLSTKRHAQPTISPS